jgi:L-lysine 2,3-aminomutase
MLHFMQEILKSIADEVLISIVRLYWENQSVLLKSFTDKPVHINVAVEKYKELQLRNVHTCHLSVGHKHHFHPTFRTLQNWSRELNRLAG